MSQTKKDDYEKRVAEARKDPLYDKMIGFMQMNPNDVVVIDPKADKQSEDGKLQEEIWQRWRAYLIRMGRARTLKTWSGIMAGGSKLTLPCADPMTLGGDYAKQFGPRNRYWDK